MLQAAVFWTGMETIRRFIDFCGPAVYVVMFLLAGYLISKAGWGAINLNLGDVKYTGLDDIPVMIRAIALVVSYFSGPMLNFGDFSRYGKSFSAVEKGNFLGLPVNFLVLAARGHDGVADVVDDLFTMSEQGAYWYRKGVNPVAVIATAIGAVVAMVPVLVAGLTTVVQYSWFIGMGLGLVIYRVFAPRSAVVMASLMDRVQPA